MAWETGGENFVVMNLLHRSGFSLLLLFLGIATLSYVFTVYAAVFFPKRAFPFPETTDNTDANDTAAVMENSRSISVELSPSIQEGSETQSLVYTSSNKSYGDLQLQTNDEPIADEPETSTTTKKGSVWSRRWQDLKRDIRAIAEICACRHFITLTVLMVVCQFRFSYFVGTIQSQLLAATQNNSQVTERYLTGFNIMFGVSGVLSPLYGWIVGKLPFWLSFLLLAVMNLMFSITNTLLAIDGVSLDVQYVTFTLVCITKSYIWSIYTYYIASRWGAFYGQISGLMTTITGIPMIFQSLLFDAFAESLSEVNIALCFVCLLAFVFPALLLFEKRTK